MSTNVDEQPQLETVLPPNGNPGPFPPRPPKEPLPLKDIQGDILTGFPKKTETWYFFQITDGAKFKKDLVRLIPCVKSVAQTIIDRDDINKHKRHHGPERKPHLHPVVSVGVGFSHAGLANKLNIDDSKLTDKSYITGQRQDAQSLGDKGTTGPDGEFIPDWDEGFKKEIHGVFFVAGDSHVSVDRKVREIEAIFGEGTSEASIKEVITIVGDVRPGELSAHEHFGYLDGISNPAIIGFDKNPPPGPRPIEPGFILLGQTGDSKPRDEWQVNGSFLTFRYLFQKVPEFDSFCERNAIEAPGLTRQEGADLLGARLVGRWKSGAPIDIVPFKDDPELGANPQENNNFHFAAEQTFQKLCPFAAHIRKTNPRADLESRGISISANRIMRRGIQFGPEVTKQEKRLKKTLHGRGLLFAAYSTSIESGFKFIQRSWANNPSFPFGTPEAPGLDPIIGQGASRQLTGTDPSNPTGELLLDAEWVVPRGGEYFFTPSISGLSMIASL